MIPAKVAALITRRVDDVTEVCVFDHAGGVQLPAGTMEPGEVPSDSAAREAWEETGLPHLELVGEVASMFEFELDDRPNRALMVASHDGCPITRGHAVAVHERTGASVIISNDHFGWRGEVPASCVERDVTRHVFHLRTTRPTPDEWWVLTPDGDGSQWRCRWVPIDEVALHPWQQQWIDAGRARVDPGPTIARVAPPPPGAVEVFDAHNDVRLVIRPTDATPDGEARGSSYGVCVTSTGDTVLVDERGGTGWGLPGGRPEPGETAEETLRREVGEEACARVVDDELLLTTEDTFLDDDRDTVRRHLTPLYWARVELDDWAPRFETRARRLIPLPSLAAELRWELPLYLDIHERALAADARHG